MTLLDRLDPHTFQYRGVAQQIVASDDPASTGVLPVIVTAPVIGGVPIAAPVMVTPAPPAVVEEAPAQADTSDLREALDDAFALAEELVSGTKERREYANAFVLGMLTLGWQLTPPGKAPAAAAVEGRVVWGVRLPGTSKVLEPMGERAARDAVKATPALELVRDVRAGFELVKA
jgi:hypothetical protein